jgi:hypothetical protein
VAVNASSLALDPEDNIKLSGFLKANIKEFLIKASTPAKVSNLSLVLLKLCSSLSPFFTAVKLQNSLHSFYSAILYPMF